MGLAGVQWLRTERGAGPAERNSVARGNAAGPLPLSLCAAHTASHTGTRQLDSDADAALRIRALRGLGLRPLIGRRGLNRRDGTGGEKSGCGDGTSLNNARAGDIQHVIHSQKDQQGEQPLPASVLVH